MKQTPVTWFFSPLLHGSWLAGLSLAGHLMMATLTVARRRTRLFLLKRCTTSYIALATTTAGAVIVSLYFLLWRKDIYSSIRGALLREMIIRMTGLVCFSVVERQSTIKNVNKTASKGRREKRKEERKRKKGKCRRLLRNASAKWCRNCVTKIKEMEIEGGRRWLLERRALAHTHTQSNGISL